MKRSLTAFRSFAAWAPMLIAAVVFLTAAGANAQTPQFTNTSTNTSNNIYPWASSSSNNKIQNPYLPNEIVGAYAGNITKVYWRHWISSSMYGSTTYSGVKIWMGQVAGNFQTNPSYSPNTYMTAGMQLCLDAPTYTVPAGSQGSWFSFQLQTPFYYNPANSLIIVACHGGYTGTGHQLNASSGTSPRRIWASGCTAASGSYDGLVYDIGIDMSSPYTNDAGITALLSPVNFCAGSFPIQVNLKNFGTQPLSSVTIKWVYDGVPQTDIPWSGNLASLADTPITLSPSQSFAPGVPHTLKAWTSMPNNVTDSASLNDTLSVAFKPALSGTFTIGGASPDYPNFTAAVADLNSNGLCGPVVFNVRSGTYTEQITLQSISGASAVNTVTFQSESGNRSDVILQYGSSSSTANMHVVQMGGADYVTFQNMTISNTSTGTYGVAVMFGGGSDYNRFINCALITTPYSSTSNYKAVVYSTSGTMDEYNQFIGNAITGGSYGVYWMGGSSSSLERENIFDGNTVTGQYYMGMYTYYQHTITVKDNVVIRDGGYSYGYLLYAYYYQGPYQIVGNKLIAKNVTYTYGIYNYAYGSANSPASRPLIANNFIKTVGTSTQYGMYLYYTSYANVYHNTVYQGSNYSSAYSVYSYYNDNIRFKNNIIYAPISGYVIRDYNSTGTNEWDYNVYNQGGPYFAYVYPTGTTYNSFALYQAGTGRDMNSKHMTVQFADEANGDLHLAGASQNDMNMIGTLVPEVTDDIDKDPRVLPYIGADEACYILPNTLNYELQDATGKPLAYVNAPGQVYFNYNFTFPDFAMTTTVTLNFINVVTNQQVWTTNFQISKLQGQPAVGTYAVNIPGTVPPGTYKIDVILNTKNSCDAYQDYALTPGVLLIVPQGQIPCVVWPGDANNDGIVNYGDRSGLNKYIILANLSPTWLQGPGRYRADAATNPLTYYTWTAQPAVPWNTPQGCYMDTDGNGTINGFDYLAIKMNWMTQHGTPKAAEAGFTPEVFDMDQNYPNPFNPSTTLRYSAPERSEVTLVVTDMLGREVATLVNGTIEAGVYTSVFDASTLESGGYVATIRMTGLESGTTFSKTVRMTVVK